MHISIRQEVIGRRQPSIARRALFSLAGLAALIPPTHLAAEEDSRPTPGQEHPNHGHPHRHKHAHSPEPPAGESAGWSQPAALVVVWGLTIAYGLGIAAASWVGGILPRLFHLSHNLIQTLLSFVGGLMLGIGVLHLLPHAIYAAPVESVDVLMMCVLGGVLLMFALVRVFHFHMHEPPSESGETAAAAIPPVRRPEHDHGAHGMGRAGHRDASTDLRQGSASWVGVLFGLGIHTLLDGVALGASIQAEVSHGRGWGLYGLGVAVAIALHKPMDSLSISSLMTIAGASQRRKSLVNLSYALLCPLGAALFHLGVMGLGADAGSGEWMVPGTLAFAAGMFLTISLSDLLPEMQFHAHNRVQLTVTLLLGVAAAWALGFLEPAHLHGH